MIKISKQTDYALQFMGALGKLTGTAVLSLKAFAKESSISFLFLQKIAGLLRTAKLIQAELGRGGGYRLGRPLGDISLHEIIVAVDGGIGVSACTRAGHSCPKQGRCTLETGMRRLHTALRAQLQEIKVGDLV